MIEDHKRKLAFQAMKCREVRSKQKAKMSNYMAKAK